MGETNIYPKQIGRKDQRGREIHEGDKVEFTLLCSCGRPKHIFTGTIQRLCDGTPYIETDDWAVNFRLTDVARIKMLKRS